MSDLIVMTHPVTGGFATATRGQFDALYAVRGWKVAEVDLDAASALVGVKINDLSELDPEQVQKLMASYVEPPAPEDPAVVRAKLLAYHKADLQEAAEKANLPTDGTKEELVDRIMAAAEEANQTS